MNSDEMNSDEMTVARFLLKSIRERYHDEFAEWAVLSWVVMAKQGLEALRLRLENREISWDHPFFPYYLLCEWDWNKWSETRGWSGPSLEQCEENLNKGPKESLLENLGGGLTHFLYTDFLRRATFGAIHFQSPEDTTQVLFEFSQETQPPALKMFYEAIQEEERRLNNTVCLPSVLMTPFRFGVPGLAERFSVEEAFSIMNAFMMKFAPTDASENDAEEELLKASLTVEEKKAFYEAFMEDVLSFEFVNEETGQTLSITAVVELSPLHLEPDTKRAFFPVVVGFEATEDGDPVSLATLPDEAHEALWGEVFKILDRIEGGGSSASSPLDKLLINLSNIRVFPKKEDRLPARLILDTPTRMDSHVRAQVSKMNKVKLPKRWERIPRWEDLTEKRIEAIKNEFGLEEGAKLGLLKVNRKGRKGGPLEVAYELSKAESERLRDSLDGKTFREERNDPGRGESLAIVKRVKTAEGDTLEVAFSWYGMDWKLVEGGRERMEEALEGVLKKDEQRLFPELNSYQRERLLRQIEHISFLRDSERLMGLLVDRFGQKGSSVFSIPLWELKAFFEVEGDPHALDRINGAFFCLTKLEFVLKRKARNQRQGSTGYGPFLVFYELPQGDGDVIVEVSQWAIGALMVFEKGRKAYPYVVNEKKLEDPQTRPSGEVVDYDFSQKMPREKRKELSKVLKPGSRIIHKATSVNSHLVNAMANGDPRKRERLTHLLDFMASELTLNRDPRKDKRKIKEENWLAPRLYGRDFCPLLEERCLAAALSHQKHNPESGRKLYGGSSRSTTKSGGSPEGLLSALGFYETSRAGKKREIREALLLMVEVVEETLGGLVALKNGEEWFKVRDVIEDEENLSTVANNYRVHLFFPENYIDLLTDKFHEYQDKRAKELGLPYKVGITRDPDLHRKNDLDRPATAPVTVEATAAVKRLEAITPLHKRLSEVRQARGLTQKEFGIIFGVSAQTVKLWETYTKGELGKIVKGRPIPRELVPLVERWIREKTVPTLEELSALKSRRSGRSQEDPLEG